MRIRLVSVIVEDQERALRFYTETLGFRVKTNLPLGEYRWLTVVSPEETEGTQLLLEPNANPAAAAFQKALFEQGIPLAAFESGDLREEHRRLKEAGVVFRGEPVDLGGTLVALFEDTCGNLIQMYQPE